MGLRAGILIFTHFIDFGPGCRVQGALLLGLLYESIEIDTRSTPHWIEAG